MSLTDRFTKRDLEIIEGYLNEIAKLENHLSDREVKHYLFRTAVFAYRQFHKAGIPADPKFPLLKHPKKVWSKEQRQWVDERELELQTA